MSRYTRAQLLQRIQVGLPSSLAIADPVARQCFEALREALLLAIQNVADAEVVEPIAYGADGSLVQSPKHKFSLENDEETPGSNKVYGTNADGERIWKDDPKSSGGGGEAPDGINSIEKTAAGYQLVGDEEHPADFALYSVGSDGSRAWRDELERLKLSASNGTCTHKVDIDPAAIKTDATGTTPENVSQTLQIRPLEIWEDDGTNAEGGAHIRVMKQYALMSEPSFARHIELPVGEQGIQGIQGIKGDKGDQGDPGASGITLVREPLYIDATDEDALKLKLKTNGGLKVAETEGVVDGLELDVQAHSGLKIDTGSPSKGLQLEGLTPGTAPTTSFVWGWNYATGAYGKFSLTLVSLT